MNFNFAFSRCATGIIYQAFDGYTELLQLFNFAILPYCHNWRKFHARKNNVVYSM